MATQTLSPLQQELLNRADSILAAVGDTVKSATNVAGQAVDFAKEQLPDIAMQYVAYGRATSTSAVAFGVFLLIVGAVLFYIFSKSNNGDVMATCFVFGALSSLIGLLFTLINFNTMLMTWFAPKVWLIQEIAKLAKTLH